VDSRTAESRRKRLVRRPGVRDRRRLRWLQHRIGDERLDHVAVAHVWCLRFPSDLRAHLPRRRHGAVLDHRQARPICRSAEDCALVFDAVQGPDGIDYSIKQYPFNWNANLKLSQLKIAYFKANFERRAADGTTTPIPEAMNFLKVLEAQGAKLEAIEVPTPNYGYLDNIILNSECGAAFEPDTLNSKIKELEPYSSWPNTFRSAQFIPRWTTSTRIASASPR